MNNDNQRAVDKKKGRRKAGTYGRTAKPAQKRRANKATRILQSWLKLPIGPGD